MKARLSLKSEAAAEELLVNLAARGAIHRASSNATGLHAYPFSDEPTRHGVALASGTKVFAMCAVDALGIPFMLHTDATIDSSCLLCDVPVTVVVKNGLLVKHSPRTVVVGNVPLDCCSTPATDQCPHINFFCKPAHLREWQQSHTDQPLTELTLAEALARGQQIFGPMLSRDNGQSPDQCCK
ncbi:alkylmercury lyase family protein [Candidatus Acetothermia bacterium]|nr:alkylmercury lyase family protein [Candidatus Acetothermia bacterium]